MPLFVIYLLKLSVSLAVVSIFYQLVLRRLTFYNWNRWYLLGYAALAFFMPAVNVAGIVENGHPGSTTIMHYIPVIGDLKNIQVPTPIVAPDHFSGFNSWDGLLAVLMLGSAILLIRLLVRWVSLSKLRRRSVLIGDMGNTVKIYQVEGRIVPFSFGDAIYINRRQHTEKEWEEIILHEYVHIRQRHTVDILLAELLCILNWYNPFVWLIRHGIRQNLEFIADCKVLENGHDKKGYQYHLLQVIGKSNYRLANKFNFSSLKKRIIMMNKIKTAPLHLVKFLFVLPLLAVLLVAFRSRHAMTPARPTILRGETRTDQPSTGQPSTGQPSTSQPSTSQPRTDQLMVAEIMNTAPPMDSIPANQDAGKEGAAGLPPMGVIPPGMRPHPDSLHQPLYFVDGVESVNGKDPQGDLLAKMNPFDIQSIDVLGPDSARKVYGEKGKNGAIFIYMKKMIRDSVGKDSMITFVLINKDKVVTTITHPGKDTASITADQIKINSEDQHKDIGQPKRSSLKVDAGFNGLILLDGKEISKQTLESLENSKIKSYTISIGNETAIKQYGEKARNGLILVVSK